MCIRDRLALAAVTVGLTDEDLARAKTLEALGLVGIDALHVALAESSRADVFLTTDDRLCLLYTSRCV